MLEITIIQYSLVKANNGDQNIGFYKGHYPFYT